MSQLSIIIPTLNEAGTIEKILRSLQDLRTSGHEVIVIDGRSTDNTWAKEQPRAA